MKGFVSTLVFAVILSVFILIAGLDYRAYSSMVLQKQGIDLMQLTNERIYSMQDGFKKTVEDANKDVENKVLDVAGEAITLATGDKADYLDEVYMCYKIQEWAAENNYSANTVLVSPFDLSEEKPTTRIISRGKQFNSINSEVIKETNGKLSLSNVLLCAAFLNSNKNKRVVEVGFNKDLPFDFSEASELLSKPMAFSVKSKIGSQEVKALILGGEEL